MPSTTRFKNANDVDAYTLRGSLLFEPTEAIRINPSIFYQYRSGDDTSTLWESLTDRSKGEFVNGYQRSQPSKDHFVIPSLKVSGDLSSALELTSITSYFDRRVHNIWDYTELNAAFIFDEPVPFVPGWVDPGFVSLKQRVFSQEVRLSSNGDSPLKWTVGGFYSRGVQDDAADVQTNTIGTLLPIEAIFGIPLQNGVSFLTSENHTIDKQYALFGQFDYRILKGLTVTAGLRYSITSLDFTRTLGGPINYPGTGPAVQTRFGEQKSKPFTPKLAINYQADENNLFYASASKGFRIGGVNSAVFANCVIKNIPVSYGPDTTWSYEVGSKNRLFGGAVRIEQSLFYIKWNNIQQDVDAGCGGNSFTDNLGSAVSKGFDLQASARLSPNLSVSGSVGYVRSRLQKTITDAADQIVVRKGDALIGSPWQVALNTEYHRPVGDDAEGYFATFFRYNSRNNGRRAAFDTPNAVGYDPTVSFDPAVTELNLRTGARFNGIDASLFVNNLLDSHPKLQRVHDTPTSPLYFYQTLRPRVIGLTVTVRR